jgi:hypothetical protein
VVVVEEVVEEVVEDVVVLELVELQLTAAGAGENDANIFAVHMVR